MLFLQVEQVFLLGSVEGRYHSTRIPAMQTYFPRNKNVEDNHSAFKTISVQGAQNEFSSREPSIAAVVEPINKLVSYKGRGFEEDLVDICRRNLDIPSW